MCLDNLWITLEHDRGINTPSQVHDLACVKMGSSRLDQGIYRSEGEGIEVTRDERKIFTVSGVCLHCRSGKRLDGIWPGDVCVGGTGQGLVGGRDVLCRGPKGKEWP